MNNDLYSLLATDIPSAPVQPDGFLDITMQGHKENIISRIYGYFLNRAKNEAIANVFIDSLLELVSEECNKDFSFESYECYLEYGTNNGNRIDILIKSESAQEAIIIENKIYHGLFNDLEDYWNTINYPEANKVGILLTLNKSNIPIAVRGKFINITHNQWIERIKQKGIPPKLSANEYVYLTDFIRNIENLTKSETMNEQAKFFFENTDKVLKAIETQQEAEKFIKTQLELCSKRIATDYDNQNWHISGTGWGYRQIWDGTSHVYYTIIYDELLKPNKEVNIIIEIYEEAIKREQELIETLKDCKEYINLYRQGRKTPHWIHFAANKYHVSSADMERLCDFVYETIKRDFEAVMNVILKTLNG